MRTVLWVLLGALLASAAGVLLLLVVSFAAYTRIRAPASAVVTTQITPPASPTPATLAPPTIPPFALPPGGRIEMPASGARLTLPVHVLARIGEPGERVAVTLRWQDGTSFTNEFTLLPGADGRGLLIGSLDWLHPGQRPPEPPTQPATVQVRNARGEALAQQAVTLLAPPDAQVITLYWYRGETLQPEQRRLPPVDREVARVALEELLWGPPPGRLAGYTTALPMPGEVLAYPGREPDWGPRVTLRGLTIRDGVATADFSPELRAYGGGSTRVLQIREQVTRTLTQFPSVREVRIAVEGETAGALEP